jgi:hypothetical protein
MNTRALLLVAAVLGLNATQAPARASPNAESSVPRFAPLTLYVAKGTGCGEGCDEWIAAEGGFDLGSAHRLRAFLAKFPGPIPPIYFQSPGGIQEEAMAIGRLMHERGMTAGVARTLPYGCAPGRESEERCLALKRSGQMLAAELSSTGATCSSACVYALLGAKVRLVAPDARLGVHASRRVHVYPDGRLTRAAADDQERLADATSELKRYVREMGVDVALIEKAFKTKFTDAYFLSHTEIVRFGIDPRDFQETRWRVFEAGARRASAFKVIVERRGPDDKDVSTSLMQLTCAEGDEIRIGYVRAVSANEIGPAVVRVLGGDSHITFARPGAPIQISALERGTTYEPRAASAPLEFFEGAAAAGSLMIAEFSLRPDSPHVLTLSTDGLSEAAAAVHRACHRQSVAAVR